MRPVCMEEDLPLLEVVGVHLSTYNVDTLTGFWRKRGAVDLCKTSGALRLSPTHDFGGETCRDNFVLRGALSDDHEVE